MNIAADLHTWKNFRFLVVLNLEALLASVHIKWQWFPVLF